MAHHLQTQLSHHGLRPALVLKTHRLPLGQDHMDGDQDIASASWCIAVGPPYKALDFAEHGLIRSVKALVVFDTLHDLRSAAWVGKLQTCVLRIDIA